MWLRQRVCHPESKDPFPVWSQMNLAGSSLAMTSSASWNSLTLPS